MSRTSIFKIITSVLLIIGLYAFSSSRNSGRSIQKIEVHILNDKELLITTKTVKNMLVEKMPYSSRESKFGLPLENLEIFLKSNRLIERADLYTSPSGVLNVDVQQRVPFIRVQSSTPFYIDSLGQKMPMSKVFTPRIPVFFGWREGYSTKDLYELSKQIRSDAFLTEFITGIWRDGNDYMMSARMQKFDIRFGSAEDIALKFLNFKAFYQVAFYEESLYKYREINLKYKGQVICKKK